METTDFNFAAWPHCCRVVTGSFEVSVNYCWTNFHTKFCSRWYSSLNTSPYDVWCLLTGKKNESGLWCTLLSLLIVNIGGTTLALIWMSSQRKPHHWSYGRFRLAGKHYDVLADPLTSKIILCDLWTLVQHFNASWVSSFAGRGSS